ncbi:hypothetical protein [uncultured Algibacter sp.]|uniref:EF-hand domain-containing protein n=1 Tax=uncultured Algibacter sp. TaxID=298659 RepID=UPI00260A10FD|nr:hypothetical protein [uncultured Algibacter sp.]
MKIFKGIMLIAVLMIASNATGQDKNKAKRFSQIDADGNSEITMEEMVVFQKGKTNKKGKPIDSKLMFLGLDSDEDGKLTLEEFSQPIDWKAAKEKRKANKEKVKSKKQNVSKDKQTQKFGWIDTDKNDAISLEELKEFHKGKKTKKGEPIKTELMFLGLDSNDDDKITLEEFKQPINWKAANEKSKK